MIKEYLKDDEFYKTLNSEEKEIYEQKIKETYAYSGFLLNKAVKELKETTLEELKNAFNKILGGK